MKVTMNFAYRKSKTEVSLKPRSLSNSAEKLRSKLRQLSDKSYNHRRLSRNSSYNSSLASCHSSMGSGSEGVELAYSGNDKNEARKMWIKSDRAHNG